MSEESDIPEEYRKALAFVRHIESHLEEIFDYHSEVICKICDKTIDEIWKEHYRR